MFFLGWLAVFLFGWNVRLGAQCSDLGQAVDNCNLVWTTGGDANWFASAAPSYVFFGPTVAQSGKIDNGKSTFIQTTVNGPGTLTFNWRVSCQPLFFDYLNFTIDNVEKAKISGYADSQWQKLTFSIPDGQHLLKWAYTKDFTITAGDDAGWLDKVDYLALAPVTIIAPAAGATVKGNVLIQTTTNNNVSVSKVEFYVDDALKGASSSAPFQYTWKTDGLSWGTHTLQVKAYDTLNQPMGSSPKVSVKVDNPPSISITNPSNGATLNGTVSIQANASDDQSVSRVEFYVDGSKLSAVAAAPYVYSWDTTLFSNDAHILRVVAVDASNQTSESQITVYVNNSNLQVPADERAALVELFNTAKGVGWRHHERWIDNVGTECTWYGVSCSPGKNHIIGINLFGNNLIGTIPSELGNLKQLNSLNLSGNFLTGSVPATITGLVNLTELILYNNQLAGGIPPDIGNLKLLQTLNLSSNGLWGGLPPSLGNCSSLVELRVSRNSLTGGIPSELGLLGQLKYLYLDNNQLTGLIPVSLGNLAQLTELSFSENSLSGEVPTELGSCLALTKLEMYHNQISGGLPRSIGNLLNLSILDFHDNGLSQKIPTTIGNLTNLTYVDLSSNSIDENIPAEMGNLVNLAKLYLSSNRLSGSIPSSIGNMRSLLELRLDKNNLTGELPSTLGNLSALASLQLFKNGFTGTIPATFSNLTKLFSMDLGVNQLTGDLPATIFEYPAMEELYLDSNQFTGKIPKEIGSFKGKILDLSSNQLQDLLPVEMSGLPKTLALDLRWNAILPIPATEEYKALIDLMAILEPDYLATQTLPPGNLMATALSASSIEVQWDPVSYTSDPGGYQVLYSRNPLGPYSLAGTIVGKNNSNFTVINLLPSAWYYFIVESFTDPHIANDVPWREEFQQNKLFSSESSQPYARTADFTGPTVAILQPADNAAVSGIVQIKVSVTSQKPIQVVKFYMDGVEIGNTSTFPYEFDWNTAGLSNRPRILSVQAFDINGLWGKSQITVQIANPVWIVPSSARISGQGGAFWTTDLIIANTGTETVNLTAKFLGHGVDGRSGPEKNMNLESGKSLIFDDVLSSLFGLSVDYGAIQITSASPTLAVQSQTWTPMGKGSFGQSVPSAYLSDLVNYTKGRAITAIEENVQFRSNLVLANAIDLPIAIDVRLQDMDGNVLGSQQVLLPPLGMTQISQIARYLGVIQDVSSATLSLSTSTQGGSFAAYVSLIDNRTNDPRTLLPKSGKTWLLPSSAHSVGSQGTVWVTDLTIANLGPSAVNYSLRFVPHETDAQLGPIESRTIARGGTVSFADVLNTVFGVTHDYGALQLFSSSDALIMEGNTYTSNLGGTYGQSLAGLAFEDMVTSAVPKSICGVREDSAFRTNLVLANGQANLATVTVTLVSSDGETLGTHQYSILPMSMIQVSAVVRALGITTDLIGARLVISTPDKNGFIGTYATVIDNTTNDPRTLLAQ
jgi:Leucine-rich repeat (LRR) protein